MKRSGTYTFLQRTLPFVLLLAAVLLQGCNPRGEEKSNIAGDIRISVDETLTPVIDEELTVFMAEYPEANITLEYVSEQEATRALLLDSSKESGRAHV